MSESEQKTCPKSGQRYERDYEIIELSKERGYAKLNIIVRERQSKKGYGYLYITIPKPVADALNIKSGKVITIEIYVGKR